MTWIKICGNTNLEDALMCAEAGADALGFVFAESPRKIDAASAAKIIARLPAETEKFGVYLSEEPTQVLASARNASVGGVQYYGEACEHCFEKQPLRLIPAFSMNDESVVGKGMMWDPRAVYGYLLDSRAGGSGKSFDWNRCREPVAVFKSLGNVIVAGGLTPENVGEAIRILKPWGVDVVTGVERAPGKKDPAKVRAFIQAVRAADAAKQ